MYSAHANIRSYKDVILVQLDYLCQNYTDQSVKSRWPGAIARMLSGAYPHADQVISMLLRDKLMPPHSATPPSTSVSPGGFLTSSSPVSSKYKRGGFRE